VLTHSAVGGWAHGHASNSRFYWKPDLYEIGEKLAELEADVDAGKPGAQKVLKSFRAERILLVDSIIQVGFHSVIRSSWNNASIRAVPNLRSGSRRRQRPKLTMYMKEEAKDAKRRYQLR
jgi:hypothetical protein